MMPRHSGHSLVELIVAMGLTAVIALGVASLYVGQNAVARSETQRDQAQIEAHYAFDVVTRLLRQAEAGSVRVTYPRGAARNAADEPQRADDALIVDFLLPAGFSVWPNDRADAAGNYPNNAIRLVWSNSGATRDFQIAIAAASSLTDLDTADPRPIAGGDALKQIRIINFDVWPLDRVNGEPLAHVDDADAGGYAVQITARTATADGTFQHASADDQLRHYRTYSVSGTVAPRN